MPERMAQVLLTALRRQVDPNRPVEVEVTDPETALAAVDAAVLATMYGESPVGIAVLDPTGRYLRINDLLARANGPSPEEHVVAASRTCSPTAPPPSGRSSSGSWPPGRWWPARTSSSTCTASRG